MDSNMSTAAYMHRAGSSSSASSVCGGSQVALNTGNGNGGGRVAVIGVTRNVRLRRRGNSGFGFSLRGGREYAAGFYVSDVQPGGEAHRNGLRVGDQIIRVNGYPVEDAVHQEVALLAKNQQVLVLKIRSVGMIPVKDNPNDPVTWHMVQQQQQQIQFGDATVGSMGNEIRIRVMVGEKGRLGCGVCRGIVPGLTVQGTREGGPARAAGLKAGDVILWCNGQRLTDLPFERAIEVMRSAAVLDLIVNRPVPPPNHLYDCPEPLWLRGSSGYDSDASSILTGSPPPMQQNLKSSPQHRPENRTQACNRNGRNGYPLAQSTSSSASSEWNHVEQSTEWSRKPNNTTVIRISQNQTPNHCQGSQFGSHHSMARSNYDDMVDEPLYDPVAPRDFEIHDFDANPHDEMNRRADYRREHNHCEIVYNTPSEERIIYPSQKENNQANGNRFGDAQRSAEKDRKTVTTVEVHQTTCPPAPPCMPPPMPFKWQAGDVKPINAMGMQMGSTMSMGSTGSTETESSLESCGKDCASTSSSLSTSSCEPASSISLPSTVGRASNGITNKAPEVSSQVSRNHDTQNPPSSIDLSTAITQELQRRAKQRSMKAAAESTNEKTQELRKTQNPDTLRAQEQKVTHDKLMEEFKRAHQRMFSNAQRLQNSEQEQEKRSNNNNSSNSVISSGPPAPPPLPLACNTASKSNEDAVEMQSIESFKLKESPTLPVPKPPSTYFANSTSSTTSSNSTVTSTSKSLFSPSGETGNDSVTEEWKKLSSPTAANGKSIGKVAIRIGAYEGETKQPSRLEFLPQQQRAVNQDEETTPTRLPEPVVSRLQNELAATLQRSNLRRKTEEENSTTKITGESKLSSTTPNENNTKQIPELKQGTVEKLTSALSNKVTIRVNPESNNR